MKEKKCCGIYDYDGVFLPGEELMDRYIETVCRKATNRYGEELFSRQLELTKEKQRLVMERDLYSDEMKGILRELAEIDEKIKEHFELKDQVLEEAKPEYENVINYDEIYRVENVFPGVLESLWEIDDRRIYDEKINNSHINVGREVKAKDRLLKSEFPPMIFVPIRFHALPYRGEGTTLKNQEATDKVFRMTRLVKDIGPLSTYVDNSPGVIKCVNKCGFRPYLVHRGQDPRDVIIQAANDTIDIVHGGKIKKLTR